jgi:hypothetical protein
MSGWVPALLFLNDHSMTLSAMAFGKMTLSIRCFYSITMLCKYAECHILFVMLNVIMLSVVMMSVEAPCSNHKLLNKL